MRSPSTAIFGCLDMVTEGRGAAGEKVIPNDACDQVVLHVEQHRARLSPAFARKGQDVSGVYREFGS